MQEYREVMMVKLKVEQIGKDKELPLAHHWEFWYNTLERIIYASFILAGKILWHLIDFGISARTAAQINEKIRKRKMEQR